MSVTFRKEQSIGYVDLDLNEANTFDLPAFEALESATVAAHDSARAGGEQGIQALVLRSDTQGVFSQGLNLAGLTDSAQVEPLLKLFFSNLKRLYQIEVPVIAALNGHALGYGCMLALVSDFRIVADAGLRIGLPEVKIGIPIPRFVTMLMQQVTGPAFAGRHMLLGNAFKADEALERGFADRLVPAEKLDAEVTGLARKFKSVSGAAVGATRTAMHLSAADLDALIAEDLEKTSGALDHPHAQEGMTAAREGRRPRFA